MDFCRYQFHLIKAFLCKFRECAIFQSVDDKAIVPIGKLRTVVSTGVRSHHVGLVTGAGQNVALDHDYNIAGIVSSVSFIIDIQANPKDSFYNGQMKVSVKDKVFQPSSPLKLNLKTPILIRYTDGWPDHRTTYKSAQLCSLIDFIALELNFMVCDRTAHAASYFNPAACTISVLNLDVQNVALQRSTMSPNVKRQAKSLSTLKRLRSAATRNQRLKDSYT